MKHYKKRTHQEQDKKLVQEEGDEHEQDVVVGQKHKRVKQLLKEITRQPISDENKDAFLNALEQTQPKHVPNYIRGKGKRVAKNGDDWPLLISTESNKMSANRLTLIKLIDSRNGLLNEMISVKSINNRKKKFNRGRCNG